MKWLISILILSIVLIDGCTQQPTTITQTKYVCSNGSTVDEPSLCKPINESLETNETKNITAVEPLEIDTNKLEKSVFELVNNEREIRGIKSLKYSEKLAQVAREHSKDTILRDYCEHDTPEGKTSEERIRENNFFFLMSNENLECIWNLTNNTSIAELTVYDWMNSPGHRNTMLTKEYSTVGVGAFCFNNSCSITIDFIDDEFETNSTLAYPYLSYTGLFDPKLNLLLDDINTSIFINSTVPINFYIVPNEDVFKYQTQGTNFVSRWFVQNTLNVENFDVKKGYGLILENLNPTETANIITKVNYNNP